MNYLGINITKFVQDVFTEKYKWKFEIKDLRKWRDIANSWIESLNIVKMLFLPKLIYRFSAIYRCTARLFYISNTLAYKSTWVFSVATYIPSYESGTVYPTSPSEVVWLSKYFSFTKFC